MKRHRSKSSEAPSKLHNSLTQAHSRRSLPAPVKLDRRLREIQTSLAKHILNIEYMKKSRKEYRASDIQTKIADINSLLNECLEYLEVLNDEGLGNECLQIYYRLTNALEQYELAERSIKREADDHKKGAASSGPLKELPMEAQSRDNSNNVIIINPERDRLNEITGSIIRDAQARRIFPRRDASRDNLEVDEGQPDKRSSKEGDKRGMTRLDIAHGAPGSSGNRRVQDLTNFSDLAGIESCRKIFKNVPPEVRYHIFSLLPSPSLEGDTQLPGKRNRIKALEDAGKFVVYATTLGGLANKYTAKKLMMEKYPHTDFARFQYAVLKKADEVAEKIYKIECIRAELAEKLKANKADPESVSELLAIARRIKNEIQDHDLCYFDLERGIDRLIKNLEREVDDHKEAVEKSRKKRWPFN